MMLFAAVHEFAFGTKQTFLVAPHMSALTQSGHSVTPNEIGAEEQSPRITGLFDLKYCDAKANRRSKRDVVS